MNHVETKPSSSVADRASAPRSQPPSSVLRARRLAEQLERLLDDGVPSEQQPSLRFARAVAGSLADALVRATS